ncbi:hypothetical protein CBR_g50240 [Chara braunii]|uniref:Uncharacterized protein n=1 Tax=Chara braunii TaxID=69332 RepID=A0A388M6J3_CHABU|nr:hypothetical protein CBR_g50240 [Chara braunii]|eukprot:GBG90146.1 hypothetical protein CBR_g50240 [Chara braunii]
MNQNQGQGSRIVKLEDVMLMLKEIVGKVDGKNPAKGNENAKASTTMRSSTVQNEERTEEKAGAKSDDSEEEEGEKLRMNRGSSSYGSKREIGVIEYMRQRLDHYMEMNGRKVKSLCLKQSVKWVRKEKGASELARRDTKEFTQLVNGGEGAEAEDEEHSDATRDNQENVQAASDANDLEDISGN